MVKNPPAVQGTNETRVRSLGWECPLEEEMATHSSILAWDLPWTEEPGGLQRVGCSWGFAARHRVCVPLWWCEQRRLRRNRLGPEWALRKCWLFVLSALSDVPGGICRHLDGALGAPGSPSPLPPSLSSHLGSREQTWSARSRAVWSRSVRPALGVTPGCWFLDLGRLAAESPWFDSRDSGVTSHKCEMFIIYSLWDI